MGEYRLTNGADAESLKMFLYGFEVFGAARAKDYREGMNRSSQLADQPGIGRPAKRLGPGVRRHEHARHPIFYEDAPECRAAYRSGSAYISPPLVHRSFMPRGRPIGLPRPRWRSKLSP
jgi:toxin ParE1/3/4